MGKEKNFLKIFLVNPPEFETNEFLGCSSAL